MESKRGFRSSPQLLLGLIVLLLGLIFTLENLDVLEANAYLRFWPAAFVLFGLYLVGETKDFQGRFTGVLVAFIGCVLLLESLGYISFSIWDFWPLILVFVGVNLIWHAYHRKGKPRPDSSNTISGFAVLGGFERNCGSQDFQGGQLTAFMGGCQVDLRQASIEADQAIIETFVLMGGIELKIPEDWTVSCKAFPFMGAIEDKTVGRPGLARKQLVIRGFAIMGGVEIRN